MKRTNTWMIQGTCLALLALGATALRSSGKRHAPPAPPGTAVRSDAQEALRRARLEQDLIRAEKTALLLGELAAVGEISE